MGIDLTDIGIEEGQKYEGIYTTMSKDGVKNARKNNRSQPAFGGFAGIYR